MKWKLLLRRMSVSAPRMTVRTHIPWPVRILAIILMLGVGGALALWIYDAGRRFAGFDSGEAKQEVQRLRGTLAELTIERDKLRAMADSSESKLAIERAAQQKLADQVKALEADNTRLKEDLAFFEALLPADGRQEGIVIRSARVERDSATGQYRYRVLLMQGGKSGAVFTGRLVLTVNTIAGGRSANIILPSVGDDAKDGIVDGGYSFTLRRYQRIEGSFSLPAGTTIRSVQVRVMEGDKVRAQQTVNP